MQYFHESNPDYLEQKASLLPFGYAGRICYINPGSSTLFIFQHMEIAFKVSAAALNALPYVLLPLEVVFGTIPLELRSSMLSSLRMYMYVH